PKPRSRRSASAWAICLQRPFAETSAHPCRGIAPPDLRAAGEGHTQDDPAISHATSDQPMHERCAARLKNAQFARACGSFVLGALATNERITSQRALLDAGIRPAFLGGLCREILMSSTRGSMMWSRSRYVTRTNAFEELSAARDVVLDTHLL